MVDSITDAERESALRCVLRDGMASQAMASLTGSAILVAFAVELGASNALIGILAAIPQLAQLVQLPSIELVRRLKNRRLINVMASSIGRMSWLVLAIAPFFTVSNTQLLSLLVFVLLISSLMAAVANCGWNSWMHDLIPKDKLGFFFGRRFSLATSAGVVVSFVAAWFLDYGSEGLFKTQLFSYSIIFASALAFGMLGVIFISKIPEPRYEPSNDSIVEEIRKPFRDRNFRNLIHFLASWQFALYLATPFFSVYMLRRLEMDLIWVIGLIALGRVVNILFLRLWGSFSDLSSHKSVLAVSVPLCLLCILGWTFTTMPEKHVLTLPLLIGLHMMMGIAMAGITLATGNIGLKLSPAGEGTSYLASVNFVGALAAGLAPVFSGKLVDFFVERKLTWTIQYSSPTGATTIDLLDFQQWDFLFFASFLLGLYALHRLSLIVEAGEVEERVVIGELFSALGREMRDFSTIATIRNVVNMVPVIPERRRNRKGGKRDFGKRRRSAVSRTDPDEEPEDR